MYLLKATTAVDWYHWYPSRWTDGASPMFCYCCHRWIELLVKESPVWKELPAGAWNKESSLSVRSLHLYPRTTLLTWNCYWLEALPVDRAKLGREKGVTSLLCKSSLLWWHLKPLQPGQNYRGREQQLLCCLLIMGQITWLQWPLQQRQPHAALAAPQLTPSGVQHSPMRPGCSTLVCPDVNT